MDNKKGGILERIKTKKEQQIDSILGSEKSMHDASIDKLDLQSLDGSTK